jgi:cytochrome P450
LTGTTGTTGNTADAPDLYSPDSYVDGPPHALFAELRRTDPVHWQAMPQGGGYWAVLRHADVVTVARDPTLFSASEGGVVLEDLDPAQLEMMRHMLLAMDPPRHQEHRRPLAETFKARTIAAMETQVRDVCGAVLDEAAEQGTVDLVRDVAAHVPSRVIGELMGLPPTDWSRVHELTSLVNSGTDEASAAAIELAVYGIEHAARRRTEEPLPDLTTLVLDAPLAGQPMTDVDFGSFFVQLVTAGNDTTRTMLSSGVLALLQHPDELAAVRADRTLVPGAVEEILRWANPLHYFRRTATAPTRLGGADVAAGDKVAMIYTSANRDEAVFADADRFDVRRDPNPHLSFGIGEHHCLGAHLARLEGRVFLDELLDRFACIEPAGEPVRLRSNLNNALVALPLRLA